MKLERRGKYPGVKIHLEPEECLRVCDQILWFNEQDPPDPGPAHYGSAGLRKLYKLIRKAIAEDSTIFDDRTDDEIREELEVERDKSVEKLKKMKNGEVWNH